MIKPWQLVVIAVVTVPMTAAAQVFAACEWTIAKVLESVDEGH